VSEASTPQSKRKEHLHWKKLDWGSSVSDIKKKRKSIFEMISSGRTSKENNSMSGSENSEIELQ